MICRIMEAFHLPCDHSLRWLLFSLLMGYVGWRYQRSAKIIGSRAFGHAGTGALLVSFAALLYWLRILYLLAICMLTVGALLGFLGIAELSTRERAIL